MQYTGTEGSYDANGDYRYGYNGKEEDNEIKGEANSVDYGARIYDPRVGRWMSVDPLVRKYPSLSAYNYVANTPLMAIDPDGREVEFYFDNQEHVNQMLSIINTGIGINVASVNSNRRLVVSILTDEQLSSLTTQQQIAYGVFKDAASDPRGTIGIDVFGGSPFVMIGSYEMMAIDVQDIQAFDRQRTQGSNSLAVLAHEIKEQHEKQLNNQLNGPSHNSGLVVESLVSGATRVGEDRNLYRVRISHPQDPTQQVDVLSGTVNVRYSKENSNINQTITIDRSNITDISETQTPR